MAHGGSIMAIPDISILNSINRKIKNQQQQFTNIRTQINMHKKSTTYGSLEQNLIIFKSPSYLKPYILLQSNQNSPVLELLPSSWLPCCLLLHYPCLWSSFPADLFYKAPIFRIEVAPSTPTRWLLAPLPLTFLRPDSNKYYQILGKPTCHCRSCCVYYTLLHCAVYKIQHAFNSLHSAHCTVYDMHKRHWIVQCLVWLCTAQHCTV